MGLELPLLSDAVVKCLSFDPVSLNDGKPGIAVWRTLCDGADFLTASPLTLLAGNIGNHGNVTVGLCDNLDSEGRSLLIVTQRHHKPSSSHQGSLEFGLWWQKQHKNTAVVLGASTATQAARYCTSRKTSGCV